LASALRHINGMLTTSEGVKAVNTKSVADDQGRLYQPARRPVI
jgi:hypothetical protein